MKRFSAIRYREKFSDNGDVKAYEKLLSDYITEEKTPTSTLKFNMKK